MSLPNPQLNTYTNINLPDYRQQFLEANVDHQLIDVRTVMEYRQGHLPNAINIPMDQLGGRVDELSQEKPVVLVCASGNRSENVAAALADAGYEGIYNLVGGTMVWMMNGLPLEN